MSASSPGVTTKNSPHTQPHSFPNPMPNKCLYSVVRTGRAKPTRAPKKRTQKILIKLNKTNNYPQHLCNLISSALYSSFILDKSVLVTGRLKRTTKSSPIEFFCCSQNMIRNTRLT